MKKKIHVYYKIIFYFAITSILFVFLLLKIKNNYTSIECSDICNSLSFSDDNKNEISSLHIKTLLVTGGAGYIGSHMVITLLDFKDWNIVLVDNLSRSTKHSIHIMESYAKEIKK